MISIHTDFGVYPVEYTDGMTAADAVQKLFDNEQFESRGGWLLQSTSARNPGGVFAETDQIEDHGYYYLTGFLAHRTGSHRV